MAPCSSMVVKNNYFWATGARAVHLDGVSGTWLVENNSIMNCSDTGILLEATASSGNIKSNTISNSNTGIEVEGNYAVTISRNIIRKALNGANNISILLGSDSSQDIVEYNNISHAEIAGIKTLGPGIIRSNGIKESKIGIQDAHLTSQVQILNNTIRDGEGTNNVGIYRSTSASTTAYNNILFNCDIGLKSDCPSQFNYDYTCYYSNKDDLQGCFYQAHDITGINPCFDDGWPATSWKYYLTTNSPCIDAGIGDPYGTVFKNHIADTITLDIGAHQPDVCLPLP